ncbi:hypothetical protein KCU95_g17515, partial [Aureobasidium melanogenum]
MNSGMQSPAMADHLLSSTWNPYNPRFMDQPLATSMHAVVPHNYIPHNPHPAPADPAIVRQLQDRINILEQHHFSDGLNAHFRNLQTSQSLQSLEYRFQHMQKSLSYDNSSLRLQILDLQARENLRDNEDCTQGIQLEPRSQEQKLASAMKNVNLMRIYASVSLTGNATFEEVSLRAAEQMEALAKTLRSRVNRGGAAYLLEAEDAEAWAAKLREDAKPSQQREVDDKLSENAEIPVEYKLEAVNHPEVQFSDVSWDALLAHKPDEPVEWNLSPRSKVVTPSRGSHTPDATIIAPVARNVGIDQDVTYTHERPASTKSWSVNSHASRRSGPLHALSSEAPIKIEESSERNVSAAKIEAVPIKIEEPSEKSASPVQIEAVPELQIRKVAPHKKHAAQQAKASESLISSKDDASAKEKLIPSITPESAEVEDLLLADLIAKAQVPSFTLGNAPTKGDLAPSITHENAEVETEVDKAQMPLRKLPPHRRFGPTQKAEAPKFSEVEPNITAKEEMPSPSMKTNKSKTAEAPGLHEVEHVDKTEEKTPLPSMKTKKKSKSRKRAKKMEELKAAEAALTIRDRDEPKGEVSSEKQNEHKEGMQSVKQDETDSASESKTQTWQPTYLRDLPPLPPDELSTIPSLQEMHHFDRSFILSHLGGTRWLPSFYSIPPSELSLLPGRGFYLLEDQNEPLAPFAPGLHGSLVTPILRLPEDNNPNTPKPESMHNAPLFLKSGQKYIYFGMYTYLRADRLDIERCSSLLPSSLKAFWANQLTSPNRPKWVTELLQQHLCPPPTYSGPLPSHVSDDTASSALTQHLQTHESWHRDTHLKTSFLKAEHILAAFEAPDTGAEMPGIRFWCLGLRCEGWDKGFYEMMVREEKIWEKEGRRDGEKERERQIEMLRLLGRKGRPIKW